ncbi:hypothetical protein BGZ72_000434 [Mortierella alpina]|nr:hypothetical protein BGZ72_000434 [Mortierella alpina]
MSTLTNAFCNTSPTDAQNSKRGIIAVYDIFGFHPTGIQFYDRLASANGGFQVSAPYLFKQIMPQSLLGNREGSTAWLSEHGDYKNTHFDEIIRAAVEDLRADGCTSVSIFGQC